MESAAALRRYWSPFSLLCDAHAFFLSARKRRTDRNTAAAHAAAVEPKTRDRAAPERERELLPFYFIAQTSARWTKAPIAAAIADSLVDLLSEAATLRQPCLTAGRLAQHNRATAAKHHRLRVRKHRRDREAARALHVHKVAVRLLYQPLQLVLPLLARGVRVEKVLYHVCLFCGNEL